MKILFFISALMFTGTNLFAQDYYDDINGDGFPILKGENGSVFGARVNAKDNSIKINLFRFFKTGREFNGKKISKEYVTDGFEIPSAPSEPVIADNVVKWGVGFSVKGKTEQNLGSLFSGGVFSPGVNTGGYIVRRQLLRMVDNYDPETDAEKKKHYTTISTFLFSASYTASTYRLYDNTLPFDKMKIDSSFNGYNIGLSWFKNIPVGKQFDKNKKYEGRPGNILFGISGELALKTNYGKLDKYEVKDFLVTVVDPATGTTRTIQIADDEGYGYSKNNYKEYVNFKLRPHINFIPGVLSNRVGIIFYPSYDIVQGSKPRTNFGLGFHILEKGNPTLSTVGVFFEFNDVSNGAEVKDKTFIQRSFSVGVGAAFNMFTGKQR